MATAARFNPSEVKYVQMDGLVALKIIKHCQEEVITGSTEFVQGVLLGLIENNVLEVTNCFPFPRHGEDGEDFDEVYQIEMMRSLRHVNIDHLHVGWYQSTYFGSCLNRLLLDSQYTYQQSIAESIVLVYDPMRTAKGQLKLQALRLTPTLMEVYHAGDFSPEAIKAAKLSFDKMFEEVPIVIKNSHLVNVLLCEIEEKSQMDNKFNFLDLASWSFLEKNMMLLMECVDELNQDGNKCFNFQRQKMKQKMAIQQHNQKREAENASRKARNEEPLPEEDITKIFKPLVAPPRLDSLLSATQLDSLVSQFAEFATQNCSKMFVAESVQESAGSSSHS